MPGLCEKKRLFGVGCRLASVCWWSVWNTGLAFVVAKKRDNKRSENTTWPEPVGRSAPRIPH